MNIIGIIIAIILFMLLVIVHEAGHFFAAKLCGVHVEEFSVGMGPLIFSKTKGETQYSVRAVPFGGYCKLESEFESEDKEDKRKFANAVWWKKTIILAAGAFNNFVLCLLILFFVLLYSGSLSSVLSLVNPGSPAEAAGIMPGDKIVAIDDTYYDSWEEIVTAINESEGEFKISYIRDNTEYQTYIIPEYNEEVQRNIIGVTCSIVHSPIAAFKDSIGVCVEFYKELFAFFGDLFTGNVASDEVVGVVGIVSMVSEEAKFGIINVIYIMAILSLNLGAVNLLPFPALDGGRILFVILRAVTKDKISSKIESYVNGAGMLLLISFMILLIFKDTINLFIK